MKQIIWRLLPLIAAIALFSSFAWSQGFSATVLGSVTDNTGAVVPGVTVTVTNNGTSQKTTITTNSAGNYQAPLLPPGNYSIAAEIRGFKRSEVTNVTLDVDQRLRQDFRLELGEVSERVTVSAEAEQIQAETATVGGAVSHAQVTELPLNGRNFQQLTFLVPGSQQGVKGSNHDAQGGGLEVHGLRENSNYFWVDGIDNFSQSIGQYVVNMPPYAIDEFRVMSPTYDAEFGRTAGAQINVILRSGTNALHGDAYEFLRNSDFDAKNYFDPKGSIPAFRRNQFGVDVGGRIIRDKSFFYGAWEGLRQSQAQSASNIVPSTAEISGNFSELLPNTTITDPSNGKPFAGNIIPPERINTIGAKIASFYPPPNAGTNTLLVSPTSPTTDDVTVGKIDQTITPKNRLAGRIAFENIYYLQPIALQSANTNIPGFGLIDDHAHDYVVGLNDIHTFSPSLISEFRVGFNRFEFQYIPQGHDTNYVGQLGIQGPSQSPKFYGFPTVTMGGLYSNLGPSSSYPQNGWFDTFFIAPTLTWVKGRHTMKFGGDWHRFDTDYLVTSNERGTYSFTGKFTGNPLADLLLGYPANATLGVAMNDDTQFQFVSPQYALFAQDDWRATSKLTITFGLRYEYTFPASEKQNRLANFDFATRTLLVAGKNGVGSALYNGDPKDFQPRIGFAWSPGPKWAVRGGYGIFYELTMINQVLAMRNNVPFITSETVIGDGSTITLNNVFNSATGAVFPSLSGFSRDYKAGRVQQFSASVQRQIMPNTVVDIGYVGNRGSRLYATVNENQPAPGPGVVQTRRPYPQYANINTTEPVSSSQYDALEIRAEKRLSNGFHFLLAYTFSHAYDNYSGSGGTNAPQNAHNIDAEWGPATYDVTHRFVFSYLYELPFGRRRMFLSNLNRFGEAILGGWSLNGILTLHTGQPFTPVLAIDNSNTGQNSDRPNLVGDPFQSSGTCKVKTPTCWANPAAFVTPPQYTFGNAGRDEVRGPGYQNLDFGLAKNFAMGEQRRVEFRAEAFNIFNHPNFDNPVNTLTAAFGRILTAQPARQLQLGLRIVF